MKELLEYINKISEADTDGVEPMVHITDCAGLREDVVTNKEAKREFLDIAPDTDGDMFVTPLSI